MDAGVRLVQLRAKNLTLGPATRLAEQCAAITTAAGARFIVNDRADIASLVHATGVHLGQHDLAVAEARRLLLPDQIVGRSTHDEAQVRLALEEKADYVAIGPVYLTSSKDRPDPVVGLGGVRKASALVRPESRPLVAIGGITLETASEVIAAGADSVAVISDLLRSDWQGRAAAFVRALR